jgi:hypothetical protein
VTDNDSLVQGGKGVANGVSGGPGAASSRQQQKQKQPTRAVTGSGGKGRAQRLSGAAAAAAAHKWCQPHSLCSLSFDVAALKQALAQGTGETKARAPFCCCSCRRRRFDTRWPRRVVPCVCCASFAVAAAVVMMC